MDGTIGEVRIFAGNFAPRNWAMCDGQLLSISEHQALFSILGTTYGGDGRTSFGLPDLRGRTAVGEGQGPGLGSVKLGERMGSETVTLAANQLPDHTHTVTVNANSADGDSHLPTNNTWSGHTEGTHAYRTGHDTTMAADAVEVTGGGGGQAHENRPPSLGMNYIICLVGVYPSRS